METQFVNKRELYDLKRELDIYLDFKEKFFSLLEKLKKVNDKESLNKLLRDKTEEEWKKYYNNYINKIEERIKELKKEDSKIEQQSDLFFLDKKTKNKFLKDINADTFILKKAIKNKKENIKEDVIYTIYKQTKYGGLANYFLEDFTSYLTKKYSKFFNNLTNLLRLADIKVLSKTYISISIFTGFLASIISFFVYLGYNILLNKNIMFATLKSVPISFLIFLAGLGFFYFYPYILIGNRKKAIKNDLPFVIIHMAAIAGSGATPISIFNLILNSKEYHGLEGEIRKIVNYVNLFGYDLSTALKQVSLTTPSVGFKELLNGIISTTESGGDLKFYLKEKAKDELNTYRLERKKYVENLATYSDIYIAVLIAAPLLFVTTLSIINVIGGNIGGISVRSIAFAGTFIFIPILNIIFIVFLSLIQPET